MGLTKILTQLKDLFNEDKVKKKQTETMRALLKKLKNKELKLETQLKKEKNEKICKQIKRDLQVIQAQQKKGRKILKDAK